ncbi:hypothetical protein CXB51_028649 [Gossypium anomalum]|uniref:Uncharacterized protein n=1 Tax=Gossypium anomalum TaxID=47600 RepID=A0A8J5YJK6_9ROSI|nr:hypothetical protein CXB51_028649 [Gossypium anomalum]
MNVFYRQKKNSFTSIRKKSTKSPSLKHVATFSFDITQPPALVSHGGSLDLKGYSLFLFFPEMDIYKKLKLLFLFFEGNK